MRARGWVCGLVVWAAVVSAAAADPKPQPVDIKPLRDKLAVFKDADGGVYVLFHERDATPQLFYGTPKLLHRQVLDGSRSRNGDAWSVSIWAPRLAYPYMGMIERDKDGNVRTTCQDKLAHGLTPVTGDAAAAILDKAKFVTTQYTRRALWLARDDRGVYYYVDVLAKEYGGNGHRVFIGRKGAMKQVALTDVTVDTGGEVFSTKSGDLRLVRSAETPTKPAAATWIRGEKRTELVQLDTYMNQPLIFRDLGIYKLGGAICGSL